MAEPETEDPPGRGGQALRLTLHVLVLAALVAWVYDAKIRSPLGPIEDHIALVQAGKLPEALGTMSASYRAENDLAAFEKFVAALPGVYRSASRGWYTVGQSGRDEAWETGRVRVICSVPDGAAIFEFQLVEEEGAQRIHSVVPWKRD